MWNPLHLVKPSFLLYLQVLEKDDIMNRFQEVTTCLEQALCGIHYERLDISDEVKEQVGFFIQNFSFPFKETLITLELRKLPFFFGSAKNKRFLPLNIQFIHL